LFDSSSPFDRTIEVPAARAVIDRYLPGYVASPQGAQLGDLALGLVALRVPALRDDPQRLEQFWAELAAVPDDAPPPAYPEAIEPDPAYEDEDVARGSADLTVPGPTPRWGVVELVLRGPSHGNPFVDVDLWAEFTLGERSVRSGGFYDGDGTYRIRMLAEQEGVWAFTTGSTARSLDGLTGEVTVVAPAAGAHGPVRVDGFHFAYADGTRYWPWGTTAYAWTHQSEALQEATLATLAEAPFTKLRMCLLPKSYVFNENEPERLPFVRTEDGFDATRFDVESFTLLEARIQQLAALGIEADLILFHPYDRWGFVDMGAAIDDRLVRYAVRRLAAFANVWWSLSNEFDLIPTKKSPDWERLASVIAAEDPHRHLLGNHNCVTFFDNSQPWITHASLQRIDVYRTAENTDTWRERWGKPVVIDELGYEGDLEHGWGSLTPQELLRRCWEGAVRGGYVGHGETFVNDRDELWWSKGGELVGATPDRIGFLARIVAEAPDGVLDPCPSDWDLPWGGVEGEYLVGYFGFCAPRYRNVRLPDGEFRVDVIDTWNMTVEPLPGTVRDQVEVPMPARPYMAIRLVRVGD
jgi:hypothetical protein